NMKNLIITVIVVLIVGVGGYFLYNLFSEQAADKSDQGMQTEDTTSEVDEVAEENEKSDETETIIGTSVEGREITAYHYGSGDTNILFIGGIHGGYAWNTVLVAYELMDYLEDNASAIPENIRVTVIPVMNPDGLETVVGTANRFSVTDVPSSEAQTIAGRFNANEVDLNRNFDCDWESESMWQSQTVSGGGEVFSEPESQAIRSYVESSDPDAIVVWYSAAGGVFASNCHGDVLSETTEITNVYADASGYKAFEEFDFYDITGDMVNWFAKENISAISVLLTTHSDVEWNENRAGIEALFEYYSDSE
ncbi:MAG: M14 family metallopeptidase, partial [Candidatus Paceibacterota bacterium]